VDAARTRELAAAARLASANSNRDAAEHDLEMAQAALLTLDNDAAAPAAIAIKAPISGRVLRVHRESAGAVMMGELLVELGDPASLEVVADLLSRDAARVNEGMRVRLERWGGEEALRGRVRRVEPSGFTKVSALGVEEQRVNVLIDFTDAPEAWRALGDGYRVEARVVLTERPNTLKVPSGAIFNTEDGPAVFVVAENRASLTHIRMGVRTGLEVEILGGVSEGETVIVHPGDAIRDGARVSTSR
jgi:HlyD family secretion protein